MECQYKTSIYDQMGFGIAKTFVTAVPAPGKYVRLDQKAIGDQGRRQGGSSFTRQYRTLRANMIISDECILEILGKPFAPKRYRQDAIQGFFQGLNPIHPLIY